MREREIKKTHLLRKHFSDFHHKTINCGIFFLINSITARSHWKVNLLLSSFFPVDFYCSLTLHTRQPGFVPDLIRKSQRESQSAERAQSPAHGRLQISLKRVTERATQKDLLLIYRQWPSSSPAPRPEGPGIVMSRSPFRPSVYPGRWHMQWEARDGDISRLHLLEFVHLVHTL